jgi:hypothetical protein
MRQEIKDRAERAILDMYHNATLPYSWDEDPAELINFEYWLADRNESEIDYLQSGGAYGNDYAATLRAPCNGGKYKSLGTQAYYVRKGLREQTRDRNKYARWERISNYGTLYQWGRGGRTLAPDSLIRKRGGSSFSPNTGVIDDMNAESVTDLIQTVESFNAAVKGYCDSLPEVWKEDLQEQRDEAEETRLADMAATNREQESARPDMYL